MRWLALAALAACSKQAATTPSNGGGSAAAAPAPIDAAGAMVDAAAVAKPAANAPCLIGGDARYALGRIGSDLVTCGGFWKAAQCFTIDRKTGALTPRTETALPGAPFSLDPTKLQPENCYDGYCWPPVDAKRAGHEQIEVIANTDGKQAAVLVDEELSIFDVATKKRHDKTIATPSGVPIWFIGDLLFIQISDAGPHAVIELQTMHGKKLHTFEGVNTGGVGTASDGTIVVQEDSLSFVTVIDNKWAKHKTISRAMPKAPCDPDEPMVEPDSKDPRIVACIKYTAQYYTPYANASVITDGDCFSALVDRELVALDAKLVETARIKLPICPTP